MTKLFLLLLTFASLSAVAVGERCNSSRECAPNENCKNGVCQFKNGPGMCLNDSECAPGERCVNQQCRPRANSSEVGGRQKSSISKAELDQLAGQYFAQEARQMFPMSIGGRGHQQKCEDQESEGASCSEVVCEMIGAHNCNELAEIDAVGNACRGNHNGTCIQSVCERIGTHNCNELSEIREVAVTCRGSLNRRCTDMVCSQIGEHNCNELSEIRAVGNVCRGVRSSCIESVCQRIGTHNCNELSEIGRVAESCRGN